MAEAYSVDLNAVSPWDAPTVLVVSDKERAGRKAERTLDDAGVRLGTTVMLENAMARLDAQASLGLLWIEIDGEFNDTLEQLLRRVDRNVENGRYSSVVAASVALIDPLSAVVKCSAIELLISGSEVERVGALALARADVEEQVVRDSASEGNATRLRQLSEEVSRIASTLARLSTQPTPAAETIGTPVPAADDMPQVPAEVVRSMIRARRLRAKHLPADLFADPAWEMLLDLLQAEIIQHRVPVSSLCIAAAVPATTALRWIKTMTDRGLLARRADPHDGRRIFIEMTAATSRSLRSFMAEAGPLLV
jgi:DNA-binding MarR family transcriptional regulator